MLTYSQCLEMKLRNGQKKLENNTFLVKIGDDFGIKLHNTLIVKILANGDYVLSTGGWATATTKARMNDYSPVGVYQQKGEWYLSNGNDFFDGVIVRAEQK